MSIILYTAPNCIRCRTVKAWLADKNVSFDTVDFKEDAKTFNAFYRANRPKIYRGAEGVEFPLLQDGEKVCQGSGVILAHLVAQDALDGTVVRSDLWHGWISGLYVSNCPDGEEDHLLEVVHWLAKGGLSVLVQCDGRKPDLVEKLLQTGDISKIVVNVPGGPGAYERLGLTPPTAAELARTIELVRSAKEGLVRFYAQPLPGEDCTWQWPDRADAMAAAQMVFEATGDHSLPYFLTFATADQPLDMHGLEPFDPQLLVKFRSASRQFLFKADIAQ